ncbi:GNAT family N-acetyltransferase [Desulforamulus ruminis]|uniref:GCN5-related N-acetyltransferase n=1 Tax=Desulforamulus ruminis (strain ATCC 23193 / DSM 2154 / NCIMB 8452 / DL) TaxID=696281 RepID=F6DK83_DESRL|nr:GNAT family N-acetyltransferase [Desulforamulus ruminis]AEG61500.1 GCN5-related N-acetyltransferase [Desulforamulus ruminis DSM 2154]
MKIRYATVGDEKYIADVIINTWKVAYRGIVSDDFLLSLTPEKHEKLFKESLSKKIGTTLVLEDREGKIVGMASGGAERSGEFDCEIVALYILPGYQKKGYGKQLFKKLVQEFKANDFTSMIIWTFKANKDLQFYKRLGGVIKKETTHLIGEKEIPIVGFFWHNTYDLCL